MERASPLVSEGCVFKRSVASGVSVCLHATSGDINGLLPTTGLVFSFLQLWCWDFAEMPPKGLCSRNASTWNNRILDIATLACSLTVAFLALRGVGWCSQSDSLHSLQGANKLRQTTGLGLRITLEINYQLLDPELCQIRNLKEIYISLNWATVAQ